MYRDNRIYEGAVLLIKNNFIISEKMRKSSNWGRISCANRKQPKRLLKLHQKMLKPSLSEKHSSSLFRSYYVQPVKSSTLQSSCACYLKFQYRMNYYQKWEIQYTLHKQKKTYEMGSCQCVSREASKRNKKDCRSKPQNFQQNRDFKLEFQNKASTVSYSSTSGAPTNLFQTFADWEVKTSYQKARLAQSKWQNDRMMMSRYAELGGLEWEQKQRKDSGTTVDSNRRIETKNKMGV